MDLIAITFVLTKWTGLVITVNCCNMIRVKIHLGMFSPAPRYAVATVLLHGFQPHIHECTKWHPHEPVRCQRWNRTMATSPDAKEPHPERHVDGRIKLHAHLQQYACPLARVELGTCLAWVLMCEWRDICKLLLGKELPARGRRTYPPRNIFKDIQARGRRTYPPRNIFKNMQACGRRTYLPRNIYKVLPARGRRTYLPRNILKVLPARGRRTYPPRNIFKDMQARGRRTYPPRNMFKDMQARGRRTYLPRNIFKVLPARGRRTYLPLNIFNVVQVRSRRTYRPYGPGIRCIFAAVPTEIISAFPETWINPYCLVVDECWDSPPLSAPSFVANRPLLAARSRFGSQRFIWYFRRTRDWECWKDRAVLRPAKWITLIATLRPSAFGRGPNLSMAILRSATVRSSRTSAFPIALEDVLPQPTFSITSYTDITVSVPPRESSKRPHQTPVSPVRCSWTNLRLPRILFKVLPASGSRTYQPLSVFKRDAGSW
jgi:hypothetical protein